VAASFRMSKKGVGQLLRSPEMEAEVRRRAEVIKGVAESIAPVGGPGDIHRGLYKASFRVTSTRRGGILRDRAVAYVTNTAPYARWVEYGNGRLVPAHHVMLRAALAGGRG
jgi:hypothetical protein